MLTDIQIRSLKPRLDEYLHLKTRRFADGGGLYLEVSARGAKYWRLKYRFKGKEKRISLGVYPAVSLKEARTKRDAARRQLAAGIDPSTARKAEKSAQDDSFEAVAREWLCKHRSMWNEATAEGVWRRLEYDVFPWIGGRPIGEVMAPELLQVLRRIEGRGTGNIAHRARGIMSRIFRYAIATGRAQHNPATDLEGALKPVEKGHYAAITTPKEVGALMRAIDAYQGSYVVQCALKLAAYTFVRPAELRGAEWDEMDFRHDEWCTPEWHISPLRMKMRVGHIVPLSGQSVSVLHRLGELARGGPYVFPSSSGSGKPISDNTINYALRAMGYSKDQMTGHGFRAMARTLLDEVLGVRPDIIEHQLAHAVKDPNGRAYNRTTHLPERRRMMQAWADYIDGLKNGADVVPIRRRA